MDLDDGTRSRIDAMSRVELARLWRFAPVGEPLLAGEAGAYFKRRFAELGGMSPEVSKTIVWDG